MIDRVPAKHSGFTDEELDFIPSNRKGTVEQKRYRESFPKSWRTGG
jgi:hypothetical protein